MSKAKAWIRVLQLKPARNVEFEEFLELLENQPWKQLLPEGCWPLVETARRIQRYHSCESMTSQVLQVLLNKFEMRDTDASGALDAQEVIHMVRMMESEGKIGIWDMDISGDPDSGLPSPGSPETNHRQAPIGPATRVSMERAKEALQQAGELDGLVMYFDDFMETIQTWPWSEALPPSWQPRIREIWDIQQRRRGIVEEKLGQKLKLRTPSEWREELRREDDPEVREAEKKLGYAEIESSVCSFLEAVASMQLELPRTPSVEIQEIVRNHQKRRRQNLEDKRRAEARKNLAMVASKADEPLAELETAESALSGTAFYAAVHASSIGRQKRAPEAGGQHSWVNLRLNNRIALMEEKGATVTDDLTLRHPKPKCPDVLISLTLTLTLTQIPLVEKAIFNSTMRNAETTSLRNAHRRNSHTEMAMLQRDQSAAQIFVEKAAARNQRKASVEHDREEFEAAMSALQEKHEEQARSAPSSLKRTTTDLASGYRVTRHPPRRQEPHKPDAVWNKGHRDGPRDFKSPRNLRYSPSASHRSSESSRSGATTARRSERESSTRISRPFFTPRLCYSGPLVGGRGSMPISEAEKSQIHAGAAADGRARQACKVAEDGFVLDGVGASRNGVQDSMLPLRSALPRIEAKLEPAEPFQRKRSQGRRPQSSTNPRQRGLEAPAFHQMFTMYGKQFGFKDADSLQRRVARVHRERDALQERVKELEGLLGQHLVDSHHKQEGELSTACLLELEDVRASPRIPYHEGDPEIKNSAPDHPMER